MAILKPSRLRTLSVTSFTNWVEDVQPAPTAVSESFAALAGGARFLAMVLNPVAVGKRAASAADMRGALMDEAATRRGSR